MVLLEPLPNTHLTSFYAQEEKKRVVLQQIPDNNLPNKKRFLSSIYHSGWLLLGIHKVLGAVLLLNVSVTVNHGESRFVKETA